MLLNDEILYFGIKAKSPLDVSSGILLYNIEKIVILCYNPNETIVFTKDIF